MRRRQQLSFDWGHLGTDPRSWTTVALSRL